MKTGRNARRPHQLSRRDVVAAGAVAATAGLPISVLAAPASTSGAEAALLAVFRDVGGVAQVGCAVLALSGPMRDRVQLLDQLLRDLRLDTESVLCLHRSEIANRLAQRVRDDFAARNTVTIDGWLVSLTETQLCALAALAEGSVIG